MLRAMPSRALETEIDRLYQLPLDQFTSARNALAKTAGADAAPVRALGKPPVAAWAVNQLYWRNGDVWNALVEAAENARRAHKAVLSGRAGDVRAASRVHDEAVEHALKATLDILRDGGHPATDATKQAIVTTLRALPSDDQPGRLARVLQPGGFEALAGLSVARGAAGAARHEKVAKSAPARSAPPSPESPARPKVDAKALTRARQAVAAATRAVREAETAARREQFEMARTKREEERATEAVDKAQEAVRRATAELKDAEAAAKAAASEREAAAARAGDADKALANARAGADAAAADLKTVEKGTR